MEHIVSRHVYNAGYTIFSFHDNFYQQDKWGKNGGRNRLTQWYKGPGLEAAASGLGPLVYGADKFSIPL